MTITRRRSFGSRSRRTKPPSSSRSSTPVIDAVVSPVARASSPAVIGPVTATIFRQFRSVALIPIRSAETCPSSCMIDPFRRRASKNSPSIRCLSAELPTEFPAGLPAVPSPRTPSTTPSPRTPSAAPSTRTPSAAPAPATPSSVIPRHLSAPSHPRASPSPLSHAHVSLPVLSNPIFHTDLIRNAADVPGTY